MKEASAIKNYKWDVAISLCKQDTDFAKKLVRALNQSLKIFFYEDSQEELISKSGPEAFARIFKEQSRIVIILSRNEWSSSFYTEIERNAIVDRIAIRNEGYHFLMVIPMVKDEIPPWYPSTQIYVSPFRFSIEQIANFIEFKVTEQGGNVKPLTVEDRYNNFLERIEAKKTIINLQHSKAGVESAKDAIQGLKNSFNTKLLFFRNKIVDRVSFYEFNSLGNYSHFGYGNYLLECRFSFENEFYLQINTTQDVIVQFEVFKILDNYGNKESLDEEEYIFYYTPELQGWAKSFINEQITRRDAQVLFRNRENTLFYDLKNPVETNLLVDHWFQKLLSKSTAEIEQYI
jgi:hypothetical protein